MLSIRSMPPRRHSSQCGGRACQLRDALQSARRRLGAADRITLISANVLRQWISRTRRALTWGPVRTRSLWEVGHVVRERAGRARLRRPDQPPYRKEEGGRTRCSGELGPHHIHRGKGYEKGHPAPRRPGGPRLSRCSSQLVRFFSKKASANRTIPFVIVVPTRTRDHRTSGSSSHP